MLLRLVQRQPGESCGEIWRAVWEGGGVWGDSLGVREGAGGIWEAVWGKGRWGPPACGAALQSPDEVTPAPWKGEEFNGGWEFPPFGVGIPP